MQEFLTYLIKNIVKKPDDVTVEEILEGTTYNYQISVNQEDMGLVIGKEGRIIRSVRALAKSKAIKEGVMINVELLEPEGSTRGRKEEPEAEAAPVEEAPAEEAVVEEAPAEEAMPDEDLA